MWILCSLKMSKIQDAEQPCKELTPEERSVFLFLSAVFSNAQHEGGQRESSRAVGDISIWTSSPPSMPNKRHRRTGRMDRCFSCADGNSTSVYVNILCLCVCDLFWLSVEWMSSDAFICSFSPFYNFVLSSVEEADVAVVRSSVASRSWSHYLVTLTEAEVNAATTGEAADRADLFGALLKLQLFVTLVLAELLINLRELNHRCIWCGPYP